MYDRFNQEAREMLRRARREAQRHGHDFQSTGHLLLAILNDPSGAGRIPHILRVTEARVKTEIFRLLPDRQTDEVVEEPFPPLPFTPHLKEAIGAGAEFAREVKHDWIGVDHLLAGLIRVQAGVACRAVVGAGGSLPEILDRLFSEASSGERVRLSRLEPSRLRCKFRFDVCCSDLSRRGLDPVVGREREISRLRTVLSRRRRGSAIVVGEPGVGKTSVVHGLVPGPPSIWEVDLPCLIAGTENRGDLELRMLHVVSEAVRANRILFIEDLQSLIDGVLGEDADVVRLCLRRTLDRTGMLIGTLSSVGYRLFRREDPAFLDCFQPVFVSAATDEDSVEILAALRDRYLAWALPDELLPTLVDLARLYLPERALPGSAVDLLDEVGVAAQTERVDEEALVRVTAQVTGIPVETIRKREPGRAPWLAEGNGEV